MATREFGNREQARAECVDIDRTQLRASQRRDWWSGAWKDVRQGARRLRHNPVYALVTMATLALGMGPNIAVFSLIDSVLLRPLPYVAPERLVNLSETFHVGSQVGTGSVSYGNFVDWRAQSRAFTDLALANWAGSANLSGGGAPERLSVAQVGANAFSLLGVRPLLGRTFAAGEDSAGAAPVVVLGEGLWRRHFGADAAVVGKRVVLDGVTHEVIGVLPARITFPNRSAAVDAWTPLTVSLPPGQRGSHNYLVIGRLKAAATLDQARAEMRQIAARLEQQYPDAQEGRSVEVTPLTEVVVGNARPRLLVLLGAAGLVLLIAAANAASLLLARAAVRRREVAVLAALGATRARVARQFLVESLLLSAAGAAVGFGLAAVAVRALTAGAGRLLPRSTDVHFDGRVVLFAVGTIVLTTLLFGLLPALRASGSDLQSSLREGSRGASGGRERAAFRSTLVVAQFAISLVLLAGAGLLMRTFVALLDTETGMHVERVLTMRIPLPVPSPKYATADDALNRFYWPLLERVRALPGVRGAGVITKLPLQDWGTNGNFTIAGQRYASTAEQPFAEIRAVSPGYFDALGIPLLRGRDVSRADAAAGTQVLVVNDALAKKYFPGEDPVGRSVYFGTPGPNNPPNVIVGVVGSVRQASLDRPPMPEVYAPYTQAGAWGASELSLVVRGACGAGRCDPASLARPVQGVVRALDADQPVFDVQTMSQVVSGSVGDRRLYLGLIGTFAGLALLLAVAGIYGVIAYSVAQRTREFGIRLALGSGAGSVQQLVVWHGARLALGGLVIGIPAAVALTRLLAGLLYGVAPWDPLTFGAVALLLGAVSVVASYLPARRAARVDPIVAMRAE
jgi:predicted permease